MHTWKTTIHPSRGRLRCRPGAAPRPSSAMDCSPSTARWSASTCSRLRVAELNPRATMGRTAQAIERRVARGRVGLWRIVTRREIGDLEGWAAKLRAAHPLVTRGEPPVIDGGVLFTTNPEGVDVTSVLAVGESLGEVEGVVEVRGPGNVTSSERGAKVGERSSGSQRCSIACTRAHGPALVFGTFLGRIGPDAFNSWERTCRAALNCPRWMSISSR